MSSYIFSSEIKSIVIILITSLILFILASVVVCYYPLTKEESRHYLMGAIDNKDRLENYKDANIRFILLGGSSIGWSVSAQSLSEELDVTVINLGVSAGVGYRNIFNFYEDFLDPRRDALVLSPEYGMIFNPLSGKPNISYCQVLYLNRQINWDAIRCGLTNLS